MPTTDELLDLINALKARVDALEGATTLPATPTPAPSWLTTDAPTPPPGGMLNGRRNGVPLPPK